MQKKIETERVILIIYQFGHSNFTMDYDKLTNSSNYFCNLSIGHSNFTIDYDQFT